jgi:hypothetical protein
MEPSPGSLVTVTPQFQNPQDVQRFFPSGMVLLVHRGHLSDPLEGDSRRVVVGGAAAISVQH